MQFKILLLLSIAGIILLAGCLGSSQRPAKPELCNQVSILTNKDNCFHRVAVTLGDAKYCGQIADANTRDLCLSDIAQGNTWPSGGTD